jgi:hypothetical protein
MTEGHGPTQHDERREAHERLALPLLVPAVVFLFAVLVIYGLSRIYLELDQWEYGDVSMATPAAIGVAIVILLIATYLASRPRITMAQIGTIGMISIALLTAGSVWAAVHEDPAHEGPPVVNGEPTPPDGPPPGGIQVDLTEFAIAVDPPGTGAGEVTFAVINAGSILHNFRLIATDAAPDALPLDDSGFQVDEDALEVVASTAELPGGETEEVSVELESGPYVIICNIPTHYEQGMYAGFNVE